MGGLGDHACLPVGTAIRQGHLGKGHCRFVHREARQGGEGGVQRLAEGRLLACLTLAQSDQQQAFGGEARCEGDQLHVAQPGVEVAALEQLAH